MNLLAFDTSTDVMSVAVSRGGPGDDASAPQVWLHTGAGAAQASSHMIGAIQQLMQQAGLTFAELDAIVFGRGPGSFTGLRTACSVAQGLAFGAGVPVLPVDTLLAVAEEARHHHAPDATRLQVAALLDARMDEMYAAYYEFNSGLWKQYAGYSLISPEKMVFPGVADAPDPSSWLLAGNVFAAYGQRLPSGVDTSTVDASPVAPLRRVDALPTAAAMLRLAPQLLAAGHAVSAEHALPTYIRDKVAQTTQERAAIKAAARAGSA